MSFPVTHLVPRPDPFSPDYPTARKRFRAEATRLGWSLDAHAIDVPGYQDDALTIDIAVSPCPDPRRTLVLSSGVHGVEGPFGSAVQLAFLQQWVESAVPSVRCLLLHGLNPYGFATHRRFNEENVDLNRNFLREGEVYAGAPEGYARLDLFLNPRRPPSPWEPFILKALGAIARYGMPALRQTIAAGQYDFPQGLFFGGHGPSQTCTILAEHLPRWLEGSRSVLHLDFHTGLGAKGTCVLLIDTPLSEQQREKLTRWFGEDSFEAADSSGISYQARGGLGQWCVSRHLAPDYLFACAEFGTYRSIQVLAGLRGENQAHHRGTAGSAETLRTKSRLRELFCPSSHRWRAEVLKRSGDLLARGLQGLSESPLPE